MQQRRAVTLSQGRHAAAEAAATASEGASIPPSPAGGIPSAWRRRNPSLFSSEKATLLLDYFQLSALVWCVSLRWPQSEGVRIYLKFTTLFNADLEAFGAGPTFDAAAFDAAAADASASTNTTANSSAGAETALGLARPGRFCLACDRAAYESYVSLWILAALVLAALLAALRHLTSTPHRRAEYMHRLPRALERALLAASGALFTPMLLVLTRHAACSVLDVDEVRASKTGALLAEGRNQAGLYAVAYSTDWRPASLARAAEGEVLYSRRACAESSPALAAMLFAAVGAFVALYALHLRRVIAKAIVYRRAQAHERYVACREVEFVSGFSAKWVEQAFYVFSSYRRRGVARPLLNLAVKAVAVAAAVTFPRDAIFEQLVVLMIAAALPMLLTPLAYRTLSSNLLDVLLTVSLLVQLVPGVMLHYRLKWYAAMGWNGAILMLAVLTFAAPPLLARSPRTAALLWPTHPWAVRSLLDSTVARTYYDDMLAVRAFVNGQAKRSAYFVPRDVLEGHVRTLGGHVGTIEAQAMRGRRLPPAATLYEGLRDTLVELGRLERRTRGVSLLPNRQLEEHLPRFRAKLEMRDRAFILVSPVCRRLLLKLLAVRYMTGGRFGTFQRIQYETLAAAAPVSHLALEVETAPAQDDADSAGGHAVGAGSAVAGSAHRVGLRDAARLASFVLARLSGSSDRAAASAAADVLRAANVEPAARLTRDPAGFDELPAGEWMDEELSNSHRRAFDEEARLLIRRD